MYRPPSVRNFKLFIGELTAEAAAVHISLLEAQKREEAEEQYWSRIAKEVGIKLDGITSSRILNSQIRLSVVSIYSGFDLFLDEIESESKSFGFNWVKPEKTSPLIVLEKNFTKSPKNATQFRYASDVVDYFRLLRNSIAHPSKDNRKVAADFYKSKIKSIECVRNQYKMLSAPNDLKNISFHDIKLLCRLLIDYTEEIAGLLEPTDSMIYAKIPFGEWRKYGRDHEKLKKAARSYVHSEYSYSMDMAEEIIERFYDSLA